MAPKKRKVEVEESEPAKPSTVSVRVTRSATLRASVDSVSQEEKEIELPKRKKAKGKGKVIPEQKKEREEKSESEGEVGDGSKKTIVIEHCKQCNSFKTRAILVQKGLENGVPGITVKVNPEKPRRGCFEIREEGGEKFITLTDMKRPFKLMKDLDMDKVVSDIISKIK